MFCVWFYHWLATRPWVNYLKHLGNLRFPNWDIKGLDEVIFNVALKTIGSVLDQCFSNLSGHNGLRSWFSFFFFNAESWDFESLRQNLWGWGQGVTYVLKAYNDVNDQTGSGAIRLCASSGCFPDFAIELIIHLWKGNTLEKKSSHGTVLRVRRLKRVSEVRELSLHLDYHALPHKRLKCNTAKHALKNFTQSMFHV